MFRVKIAPCHHKAASLYLIILLHNYTCYMYKLINSHKIVINLSIYLKNLRGCLFGCLHRKHLSLDCKIIHSPC